jgi:hypothetical protein
VTAPQTVGQPRRPVVRRPWPKLPRWFVAGFAVASICAVAVLGYTITQFSRPDQRVEQRRTPSSASASHDVGKYEFRSSTVRPVSCGAVAGLKVTGATVADVDLLEDVVTGICKRIRTIEPPAENRVVQAARRGTVIGFAQFERTGDDSTTLAGTPPRIAINARFSVRGKSFKGYLAGVVMHELMHAGAEQPAVTAAEELQARRRENQLCAAVLPNSEIGRSCGDARAITQMSEQDALSRLRAAGYP